MGQGPHPGKLDPGASQGGQKQEKRGLPLLLLTLPKLSSCLQESIGHLALFSALLRSSEIPTEVGHFLENINY